MRTIGNILNHDFQSLAVASTETLIGDNAMVISLAGEDWMQQMRDDQYLAWITNHAKLEWFSRMHVLWTRWAVWHQHHYHLVPILRIDYGHNYAGETSMGYFFA